MCRGALRLGLAKAKVARDANAMIPRRIVLAALLSLPALSAAAADDCGCGGPKSNPKNRANQLYSLALASDDPDKRKRLAETILRIDPTHEGAKALLAEAGG
jgi:hypothetical protein